jgi:hypothetical protein
MLFELVCPEGLRERDVARRVRAWIETFTLGLSVWTV